MTGDMAYVPTLREQGINADADVFYTLFAPKGIDAAQTAFWEQALIAAAQGEQLKKDAENNFNRWTIEVVSGRDLNTLLEREYENYRRALGDLGLRK